MIHRDSSLDTLLELNGQVLVIDEAGFWVKFVVHEVPASANKPHGLDYSLTLHAHPVAGRPRGAGHDHKHRLRTVRPYDYTDAAALLAAFWREVESVMRERGVWT
jgi:hypothetical protein